MSIYNPNTGKLYSHLERVGRNLLGETQHGTGSINILNPKNWEGTTGKVLDHLGDAYNGLRSGVAGVMGASGVAGRLKALVPLVGAGLKAAAPVITGKQLIDTVHDAATTSTDDYNKRFAGVPGLDQTRGPLIDKGSTFDRATNALGMREDAGGYMDKAWRGMVNTAGETLGAGKIIPDDVGLRQYGRDVLTRTFGAATDIGANAADAVSFWIGPDLRKNFADMQEKQAAADRLRAATKPKPPAAPTPAAPEQQTPEVDQKAAAAALDQKMVAESPNGYVVMPPQKGLRIDTYTNVPSQIDNFANSKGTVSTIEGPGVEGWKRMLDNIRSLREPETPIQDRVHTIQMPGWAKLGGYSVQDRAMQAIDALPRDMSPGNKADAIAHLLNTANTADSVAANANADRRQKTDTSGTQNNNPSLRDLLAVADFNHKRERARVEDEKWAESNALQQMSVGASMATAQQNIDASKETMIDKQFARYFQKNDGKGNFVPDGDNIKEFSTQLGQAMATLANTNDPKDRQRFAVPYKGVDGIKWRAKQWNELDDATKGYLVQLYNFSKRVQALNKGGVGGGNFGVYRNPSRDSQGRAVFKDGDKIRAIVDVEQLNSNDNSWFPFFGGVDESFGPRRQKDIGSQFGAGVRP